MIDTVEWLRGEHYRPGANWMPLVQQIQPKPAALRVEIVHRASRRVVMGMRFMKGLLRKVQATLTAAAFAEESEAETARQIVAEGGALRTNRKPFQE
jgi:hypothetical protein